MKTNMKYKTLTQHHNQMKCLTKNCKIMKTLILFVASILMIACETGNKNPGMVKDSGNNTVKTETIPATKKPAMSIAILEDFSGSRAEYKIPELTIKDLQPAIDYVIQNGGAVMYGVIEANSDYTTHQLRIDISSKPVKPKKPRKKDFSNSYSYYNALNKYKNIVLETYKKDSADYVNRIRTKVQKFKSEVANEMTQKHNSGNTDIGSAILRSIIFHNTSNTNHHYTLLISDGIDYVKTPVKDCNTTNIKYYLCYGSNKAQGPWKEKCKPVVTPDLETAYDLINIH